MTTKQKAYIALTATSLIWGSTWVAAKVAVKHVPGLQVSAIRQLVAGILFLAFFKLKGEPWPTFKQLRQLFVVSFFLLIIANSFSTWGVKFVSSGLGALIGALYPLFVVIIEMFFFKNKNTALTFVGLLLGLAGVTVVFYDNAFHHQEEGYWWGIILGLIATLSWSIGTIFVARKKININPYYGMGLQMLIAAPFIFIMSYSSGNYVPIASIPSEIWAGIGYLVLMGSCIAFMAFIFSMKNLPAAVASLYAYINPIVAMAIGAFWLNEKITTNIIIGTVITLVGVYLVNHSMKERPTTEAIENEM